MEPARPLDLPVDLDRNPLDYEPRGAITALLLPLLATQPLFSLGVAVATFTAQNFGARKFSRIRECAKKCSTHTRAMCR